MTFIAVSVAEIILIGTSVFIVMGLLAAFIAIRYVIHQSRDLEPQTTRAFVIGNTSGQDVRYDIYDPAKLGASKQSIDFKTDAGRYLRLNVSTKDFYHLIKGMYGTITYEGNKLLSFARLEEFEAMHYEEETTKYSSFTDPASSVLLYADMKQSDLLISTKDKITVNRDKAKSIAHELYENKKEPFVGFQDKNRILQFSYTAKTDVMLVDIPDVKQKGSYQGWIDNIEQMDALIDAFFDREDLQEILHLTFVPY